MSVGKKNTSSRLRERVTLQQEARTSDGAGGYVRAWQDVADLWAEITETGGRERVYAAQLQSEVSHRVVIRYRANVTAGMRLLYESRALNIRAVMNMGEQNELLELLVVEGDVP